jgi:hypothetical protein
VTCSRVVGRGVHPTFRTLVRPSSSWADCAGCSNADSEWWEVLRVAVGEYQSLPAKSSGPPHLSSYTVRTDNCFHCVLFCVFLYFKFIWILEFKGHSSSVSVATRYGLDGPGIASQRGEIFRTRSERPRGPPSLLQDWNRFSIPGVKRPERGVNHPPHPAPR